jgi:hypothetical protein
MYLHIQFYVPHYYQLAVLTLCRHLSSVHYDGNSDDIFTSVDHAPYQGSISSAKYTTSI